MAKKSPTKLVEEIARILTVWLFLALLFVSTAALFGLWFRLFIWFYQSSSN